MQPSKSDFNVSSKARLGALVLLGLIVILVIIWRVLPSLRSPKADKEELALQQEWATFEKKNLSDTEPEESYTSRRKEEEWDRDVAEKTEIKNGTLFFFNPNTASEADLLRLGLPKHTINTILKFRARSPTAFKNKEELQKLYTLSKADYERIAPYVLIPEAEKKYSDKDNELDNLPSERYKQKEVNQTIELNTASAEQLMSLKGIGAGFSTRILRFRDGLGGFYNVAQLKEVFGFPDSTYQHLKNRFTVDITLVKQINVNIASEETLAKQSYIGRKVASSIIKLRNELHEFKEIEQLRQVPLINDEKYRKIAPYLSTH